MDSSPKQLLAACQQIREKYPLTHDHLTALAWIIAKLLKEKEDVQNREANTDTGG